MDSGPERLAEGLPQDFKKLLEKRFAIVQVQKHCWSTHLRVMSLISCSAIAEGSLKGSFEIIDAAQDCSHKLLQIL